MASSSTTKPTPTPTPQPKRPDPRATALNLLAGFATLDSTQLFADRSQTCTWQMFPHSLGFDRAGYDNAQHQTHVARVQSLLSAFPVTPLEVTVAETVEFEVVDNADDTGTTTTKKRHVVSVHADGEAILTAHVLALLEKDEQGKRLLDEARAEKDGLGMGRTGAGFRNEYYFVFYFDEHGTKIDRVVEWLDAGLTRRLTALMARAGALLAEQKGTSGST